MPKKMEVVACNEEVASESRDEERLRLAKEYLELIKSHVIEKYSGECSFKDELLYQALNCVYYMSKTTESLQSLSTITEQYFLIWLESYEPIRAQDASTKQLEWYLRECIKAICDADDIENNMLCCDLYHLKKFLGAE